MNCNANIGKYAPVLQRQKSLPRFFAWAGSLLQVTLRRGCGLALVLCTSAAVSAGGNDLAPGSELGASELGTSAFESGYGQAAVSQQGERNTSRITQQGRQLIGLLRQSGSDNTVQIAQSGVSNRVSVGQSGSDNQVQASQTGERNEIDISQIGNGNLAVAGQSGPGNRAGIEQTGNRNVAEIRQAAGNPQNNPNISLRQVGDGLFARLVQH